MTIEQQVRIQAAIDIYGPEECIHRWQLALTIARNTGDVERAAYYEEAIRWAKDEIAWRERLTANLRATETEQLKNSVIARAIQFLKKAAGR